MAADLTGIDNAGEFFSAHYLQERLPDELKSQDEATVAAVDARVSRLRALGPSLLRAVTDTAVGARAARRETAHELTVQIVEALGYEREDGYLALEGTGSAHDAVPLLASLGEDDKRHVVVLEAGLPAPEEALIAQPASALPALPPSATQHGLAIPVGLSLDEVVAALFAARQPPRWVLLVGAKEVVLAERSRWGRGQFLRFDLEVLLRRRDPVALRITAALLARELLAPGAGRALHDTLIERSHQHAVGVSAELKFAAREAVELLGNEYVHYQRTVGKKALYTERAARELTDDCLVYLFRLLFLFYAEARAGELRGLPMNAEEYLRGYSLEVLRELEQVPLTTAEARDGYFFHESLEKLFGLVNEGFEPLQAQLVPLQDRAGDLLDRGFVLKGLHSTLFSSRATPRLSRAKLRNEVLQQVIRLLSLSPEGRRSSKAWGRGRISYAQLGIGELGAVYEGLLSYSGFFAREVLYEVHREGDDRSDVTQQSYFVKESELAKYSDAELSFKDAEGNRVRRKYPPGTFIFRLAGRDREQSASYYTPEVLTACLVKYALKELLADKSADAILKLSICEPAMGSGAFLVEAIDQLADAYLERKQEEVGERLLAGDYALEKQRVKAYLAEQQCYGVDLNPMATRLAAVSLWLATMHEGQSAPSYGARLLVGNSLIGARFAVVLPEDFATDAKLAKALAALLKKAAKKTAKETAADTLEGALGEVLAAWEGESPEAVAALRSEIESELSGSEDDEGDDAAATAAARGAALVKILKRASTRLKEPRWQRRPPRALTLEEVVTGGRPAQGIYHFLLPHPDMSPFEGNKALKELAPEATARLKAWRKAILTAPSAAELRRLAELSATIDARLKQAIDDRTAVLERARSPVEVWQQGAPIPPLGGWLNVAQRDQLVASSRTETSAYGQLRRITDLWACLWAWPLEDAALLPDRRRWIAAVEEVLGLDPSPLAGEGQLALVAQGSLPPEDDDEGDAKDGAEHRDLWAVVAATRARLRPLVWELEVPEVFLWRGGFDLVVGNPPWIKLQWNEQGLLAEAEPRLALDGVSASDVAKRRVSLLESGARKSEYLVEAAQLQGAQAFLNAAANYPLLEGVQTNLYKCFLEQSWRLSPHGVVGLIHQDGLFDDPRGGRLRSATYGRLRWVFRFKNDLLLFSDVANQRTYAITIAGDARTAPDFVAGANLFHPMTIDGSAGHDGAGSVPGIKSDEGRFETRGHASRLVRISEDELGLFAQLFDKPGTPAHMARLPLVHSREALDVLRKLARHPRRLSDLGEAIFGTEMWHETNAQKDGTIRRDTRVPSDASEWVLSGPHFYVATPFNKTPREVCRHNKDYDVLDLEAIPDDYLPRTNYVPVCDAATYLARTPTFRGRPVTDFYRHVHRRMLAITGERSVVPAIIPPDAAHLNPVVSLAFDSIAGAHRSVSHARLTSNRLLGEIQRWWRPVSRLMQRASASYDPRFQASVSRPSPPPQLPDHPLPRAVGRGLAPIPRRRLDPRRSAALPLAGARRPLDAGRGGAERLRAALGAGRDRRPRRAGAGPLRRRAHHHLPHPVPGAPRLRARHLVRSERQDRLHHQQGARRRGPRPQDLRALAGPARGRRPPPPRRRCSRPRAPFRNPRPRSRHAPRLRRLRHAPRSRVMSLPHRLRPPSTAGRTLLARGGGTSELLPSGGLARRFRAESRHVGGAKEG
ncbi:MAG: N-6 DNA methylase [Polyangiaceae bacterium]